MLITSNGWPVPTKVWDFLINTSQDSFLSECRERSDVAFPRHDMRLKMCRVCVVWLCVCVCYVCFHVCMCWLRLFLPRGNEVALGRVRGQSALIPLPVRVSPPWLLAADGSHVSTLWMSALWKGKSQPGKQITERLWGDEPQTSFPIQTPTVG